MTRTRGDSVSVRCKLKSVDGLFRGAPGEKGVFRLFECRAESICKSDFSVCICMFLRPCLSACAQMTVTTTGMLPNQTIHTHAGSALKHKIEPHSRQSDPPPSPDLRITRVGRTRHLQPCPTVHVYVRMCRYEFMCVCMYLDL